MTQDEFQHKYYHYQTYSEEEARAEADCVNAEGIDEDEAIPVHLERLGWCLMLKTTADFVREMGLI